MRYISNQTKQEILDISKNSWLSGLFSAIPSYCLNITFEEHKEIFFMLLCERLTTGDIVFNTNPSLVCAPPIPLI